VGRAAAITSRVDPLWRTKSVVRGRVGIYGGGTDIRTADPLGQSAFWTKIPVIVAGRRPTTAWPGGLALADRQSPGGL
jgi:hypothetical protein